MKITVQHYGQFLINSPVNFTGTYFADTATGLAHDSVQRFLTNAKMQPNMLREKTLKGIDDDPKGFLIFDDTVLDKNHSRSIELVRKQYSGNAHRVIRGIGVVTCIYINPDTHTFDVLDYRIWDAQGDGKTKLEHVTDMFDGLVHQKVPFSTVLMDTWYAVTWLMRHIDAAQKTYSCPIKHNRKVDDSGGTKPYVSVSDMQWSDDELTNGRLVKVRGFRKDEKHKLFRVQVSTDRTDFVITNDKAQQSTDGVRKVHAIRWNIEEFHRELKQCTGVDKCRSRKARAQRNHIGLAIHAWLYLKTAARAAGVTIYEQKAAPLRQFDAQQWRNPTTVFG